MGRILFTVEFKRECTEHVIKQGYKVTNAAEAMNIDQSTLQRWVRQYKQENMGITP
nr:transposase [uncultured Glaciecola sp.]